MVDSVRQVGNLLYPRVGFDNPQEGRVYSVSGCSPSIRNDSRYYVELAYETK